MPNIVNLYALEEKTLVELQADEDSEPNLFKLSNMFQARDEIMNGQEEEEEEVKADQPESSTEIENVETVQEPIVAEEIIETLDEPNQRGGRRLSLQNLKENLNYGFRKYREDIVILWNQLMHERRIRRFETVMKERLSIENRELKCIVDEKEMRIKNLLAEINQLKEIDANKNAIIQEYKCQLSRQTVSPQIYLTNIDFN